MFREKWSFYIDSHDYIKIVFVFLYFCQFIYSFVCGMWFCTRERLLPVLSNKIRNQFVIEKPEELGYILLRTRVSDFFNVIWPEGSFMLAYRFAAISCG